MIVWQGALGIAADGYFGPATLSATNAWQHQQGLTVTGTVGIDSWRKMFPGAAVRATDATDDGDRRPDSAADTPAYPGQTLQRGSQGADVVIWQQALGIAADGHFGPQTEQATKAWQRENGLTANGIVDAGVWQEMFSGSSGASSTVARPSSVLLQKGDVGLLVERWQRALQEALPGEDIEVTGVFDAQTVLFTMAWQRIQGIAASGKVAKTSWPRMFPGENSPPVLTFMPLHEGVEGLLVLVKLWQRALNANAPGAEIPVSGEFDGPTVAKTKYWKRAEGVTPVDGKVSEKDWYRMFPDG